MLTLVLGTDWIANRDKILALVADDISQKKSGRILMVPELISHDMERRLCAVAGDTTSRYAEVLTFSRLAKRVSDSVGHAALQCLDNGGRVVAMAAAVRQLHSKLKAYASVETKPEFLVMLIDAIDEFKRCCINAEDLRTAAKETEGSLSQKLEELSLILETYDSLCARGTRDPRDQMSWVLDELENSDFAKNHIFYIEGFPDFTRQHTAILEHLIVESEHLTIGLNCDQIHTKQLAFEKAGATASELISIAKRNGIAFELQIVEPRNDNILQISQGLFQGKIENTIPSNVLQVYQAESVYKECLLAAQRIIEQVIGGARYRDFSIVCADPVTYKHILGSVLDRCKIPTYLSGTDDVLDKTVIATILAAMDTALGGFARQDMFRYIKSSLSPISLNQCDRLENYVIMWGIDGKEWLSDWSYHPAGLGQEWNDTGREKLAQLNEWRAAVVEPLLLLKNEFDSALNLQEQVIAVYHFFEAIGLNRKLDNLAKECEASFDDRSAQILNQLWDILVNALEQMYDVLGETVWEPDVFTRLFRLLLSQYDVGTIPPVLDAVMVGPVSAMRCQQVKHLFVLGAAEGCLPGYSGSAGVLTDQERTALRQMGVPLTGGSIEGIQAEFAEIYGVFCGAEETINVSCANAQPSYIFRRLSEMKESGSDNTDIISITLGDPLEAGAYFARFQDMDAAKQAGVLEEYDKVRLQINHSLGNISNEHIKGIYGDVLKLSASQVDKLADCRFHYYLRYGLRAKEMKELTVDPAEFGTYVHAVLENTAREICDRGGFSQISEDEALSIANKYSNQYVTDRFSDLSEDRMNYLFARNVKELEAIVRELWKELHNIAFEPAGFEVSFGEGCQMPPIAWNGTSMSAQLRGFVDRVDSWSTDEKHYFRVVDYKTGRKDFDYCDVYIGVGLQMLLYMFALEQSDDSMIGKNPIPAGVQYFPARNPVISVDGALSDEDAEAAHLKNWKRKGLLLQYDEVLQAMESEDGAYRMPYSRRKDGTIQGDVATREQFDMLKKYIFKLLASMVDEIASGNVEPNPYTRGASHNACDFCPYKAICHSNYVDGRRNFQMMNAQRFWEEVQKVVKE